MTDFRIADTFTASLARLTSDEQKAVKTTAFDLQLNPVNIGMSLHKLDQARDKHFWSVRVTSDIRLIVHRTAGSFMLCYVDHHDKAYEWASRRRLETHPKTGAAQWVEVRERVEEVVVRRPVATDLASKPPLFTHLTADELTAYGVPEELVPAVLLANEDTLLTLADHLPAEAAEALLELATGGRPKPPATRPPNTDPFSHPDAQRRFRVMHDAEELARALEFPWDRWITFLHPAQRQWVERDYNGPARVAGSAGTGKTIVALHRAVFLARQHPEARVLLTTFSDPLASALHSKLRRLISHEPRLADRLEVQALHAVGERLYATLCGKARIATADEIALAVADATAEVTGHRFQPGFVQNEWLDIVDAWRITQWAGYRDFKRLGRKSRLSEAQRETLWAIFERIESRLSALGRMTRSAMFWQLADKIEAMPHPPFDFVVVDEAQDIEVGPLRFLAAIGGGRSNRLFFAGDLGQRIFQAPFSWKAAGVDVRGRSRTLQINYRTSHQIRAQADRLLGPEVSDMDDNTEVRTGTVSVFNGPAPAIQVFKDDASESQAVADWLRARITDGAAPQELAVIVRSEAQVPQAMAAVQAAGQTGKVLSERVDTTTGCVLVGTMHLAKGLEFRAVVVMACNDEVVPLQSRIESVAESADLDEVYHTERHLLYVACTRARDHLLVTGVRPISEFLDDLIG
jgi:superfamily I DNA/RNA helicase/mRNA-degrading endonuclease RelE of RelBE toxin-antitoxin system